MITITDLNKDFSFVSINTEANVVNNYLGKVVKFDLPKVFSESLITAIETEVASVTPFVTKPQLKAFYDDFFKSVVSGFVVSRYMPFIGLHATQWGLDEYAADGSQRSSDKRRSELTNSVQADTQGFINLAEIELKRVSYTFDSVNYGGCISGKTGQRAKFTVIGAGTQNRKKWI